MKIVEVVEFVPEAAGHGQRPAEAAPRRCRPEAGGAAEAARSVAEPYERRGLAGGPRLAGFATGVGLVAALAVAIGLAGCGGPSPAAPTAPPASAREPQRAAVGAMPQAGRPTSTAAKPDPLPTAEQAWKAAGKSHKEQAYLDFASRYPADGRAAKARAAATAMGWRHAQSAGTVQAYSAFLQRYPNDPHAAEARKFTEGETLTLSQALQRDLVSTRVTGSGLQSVSLVVRRKSRRPLRVTVPAGTYFVCGGGAQNMVATGDTDADLTATDSVDTSVSAACANFYLDQPDEGNTFAVRPAHPSPELRRLLKVIDGKRPESIVSQLAIWSLTDNPSRDDVANHLNRAPEMDDYHAAAALLRDAGISPSSRRMFQDM
ncbi:MAG TPA: hypothetical protein VKT77_01810 [Chthonomonadaceae bacterium]|nr:hypothetical protein [Chthonomonadaceae bacterium]